jgi:hypothetical protein
MHGEHRVAKRKVRVYEPSIGVPLLMRGPGIPKGVTVRDLTVNADLAPTIVAAAGAEPGRVMDGRSLLGVARNPKRRTGRALEIEAQALEHFTAVHTQRYVYVDYESGELELYDLRADPFELHNVADDPSYATAQSALASDLAELRDCAGLDCRRTPALDLAIQRGGTACTRKPVTATVDGADTGELVSAEFKLNGRVIGTLGVGPFELEVPFGRLSRKHANHVRVIAKLFDGREMTLDGHVPRACG